MTLDANQTASRMAPLRYEVLLVDDSHDSVAIVKAYLADPCIHVTVRGDGEQGLTAFKNSAFDLVLMDIQMPVLDGCAATLAIRRWEIDNCLPRTPITALTASTSASDVARIFASGCSNYMPKPVTKEILLQLVKQFLNAPPKSATANPPLKALENGSAETYPQA